MINKLKALYTAHREIIVYLIVGGLTTLVSWTCKFLWNLAFFDGPLHPTSLQNTILSIVNWVAGVTFAFFTNRRFVFLSHAPMLPEAVKFVGSRISTFLLDWVIMLVLGNALGIDVYIATLISAVFVTIANYVFSKLFVFKSK